MFGITRSSICLRGTNLAARRFQSSSKKNFDINSLNPVLPKMKSTSDLTKSKKVTNDEGKISNKESMKERAQFKGNKVEAKKGFSSLPKVSSTYNFNPKDLLLDNFFSGYRPMTLPISPPKKTTPRLPGARMNQGGTFVYFEIDDNLDFIDELKEEMGSNVSNTVEDIERQTSTRFDHSHKSLKEEDLKKERYERELYETKLQAAKEEDLTGDYNTSNIVESKRFRGRRKLEYRKRNKKD